MRPDPSSRPDIHRIETTDLIVLGSGAAGLSAALTALLEGLSVVVLEIAPAFGGTTARSSGTSWIPGNRAMRAHGIHDDSEKAARYLETLVGNRGPRAPWEAFLESAPQMQADLEDRASILFRPYRAAPDYRQDIEGAAPGWRPLEPLEFDGRKLGGYFGLLSNPIPELTVFGGMMVTRAEAARLIRADKSVSATMLGARLVTRYIRDRLRYPRGTRLVMGNALVARLMSEIIARGGLLYESTTATELVTEAGRVTGVSFHRDGRHGILKARAGIVLAGGGFPANAAWRQREMPAPAPDFTPAAPNARGTTLELALDAGATLGPSGLDNALWFPSSIRERSSGGLAVYPHIALDRAKPGSLVVNAEGRRFVNEAVSYHEFVRGMYRANAEASSIPAWLICDRDFIRKYGLGIIRPRTPSLRAYLRDGYLKHGANVAALASAINVPADALEATINRFNGFARSGVDADFGRGDTIYERSNGDAAHGPNPCLGPIKTKDLYAVALYPTPLGTSRGLLASVDGEVLDASSQPIGGLYVCGNDMQSCFAGEYPGAGAQIGMGMTFGWRVARHAAASLA